jgi:hypothetical protein
MVAYHQDHPPPGYWAASHLEVSSLLHLPVPGIRVRLDGGFAHPDLLDFLEGENNLEYVIAIAKNAALKRKAKPSMRQARRLSRQTGKTEHVYGEANYAARTWPKQRRSKLRRALLEILRKSYNNPRPSDMEGQRSSIADLIYTWVSTEESFPFVCGQYSARDTAPVHVAFARISGVLKEKPRHLGLPKRSVPTPHWPVLFGLP